MKPDPSVETPVSRTWLRFRIGYILILGAALIFAVKFGQQAWQDHQLGQQLAAAQSQLSYQKRALNALAWQTKQDRTLAFVKQQARAWGYVQKGDRPVLISYRYQPVPHHAHVSKTVVRSQPTWQKWRNAFFGGSGQ
jgi:hypothetical protein